MQHDAGASYFMIRDACAAAGGLLADVAKAMDDAVVSGVPLEVALGWFGRWRTEARREMRRRNLASVKRPQRIATAKPNASAKARAILKSFESYLADRWEKDLESFRQTGAIPRGEDAERFQEVRKRHGKMPGDRTLRRWCKAA